MKQGEPFGTIESVKAVSELFSPITGEVIAANDALGVHPEEVNQKPHETWIIKLKPTDQSQAGSLLDASAYADLIK